MEEKPDIFFDKLKIKNVKKVSKDFLTKLKASLNYKISSSEIDIKKQPPTAGEAQEVFDLISDLKDFDQVQSTLLGVEITDIHDVNAMTSPYMLQVFENLGVGDIKEMGNQMKDVNFQSSAIHRGGVNPNVLGFAIEMMKKQYTDELEQQKSFAILKKKTSKKTSKQKISEETPIILSEEGKCATVFLDLINNYIQFHDSQIKIEKEKDLPDKEQYTHLEPQKRLPIIEKKMEILKPTFEDFDLPQNLVVQFNNCALKGTLSKFNRIIDRQYDSTLENFYDRDNVPNLFMFKTLFDKLAQQNVSFGRYINQVLNGDVGKELRKHFKKPEWS